MNTRIVEVGEGGKFLIPIPTSTLNAMQWNDGDYVKLEIVVNRDGTPSHIVLERVGGSDNLTEYRSNLG